jgi:hypothetical protein
MNSTLKLGLMVAGSLTVLWAFAWLMAQAIIKISKDN